MNYYQRPTQLQEQVFAEVRRLFAEHLKQFKANCEALHEIENNLAAIANDILAAAGESSGRPIQTDDGTLWRQAIDLTNITSVCHRQTKVGFEFAVVESLQLPCREMKDVLNSGYDVSEMLQTFVRDQRQVFKVWKDDLTVQVREHLAENHPHQDMDIVVESVDIRLTRELARRETVSQNHGRGVRV